MAGWACDIFRRGFRHEAQEKPYECQKCQYDLCQNCMKGEKTYSSPFRSITSLFLNCNNRQNGLPRRRLLVLISSHENVFYPAHGQK